MRIRRFLAVPFCVLLALQAARGQAGAADSIVARASIITLAKVVSLGASADPMVRASDRTAIVSVLQMYAGQEIAGDQKGRTATVILSRPRAVRVGQEAVFYGSLRFLGKTMTIADLAESPEKPADSASNRLVQISQTRADDVVRARLGVADLVVRGTVQRIDAMAAGPDSTRPRPSDEHDPEWRVATIRVDTTLRGDGPQTVQMLFASSRDVVWFNSPKLVVGEQALFLGHRATADEQARYRGFAASNSLVAPATFLLTAPGDVLRSSDEQRLKTLLRGR